MATVSGSPSTEGSGVSNDTGSPDEEDIVVRRATITGIEPHGGSLLLAGVNTEG